jgi:hypothetical protein
MLKGLLGSLLLLAALQEKGANPDLLYKPEAGVSVMKPPKNEEWEFKDKGFFYKDPKAVVAHRVDRLYVEILGSAVESNQRFDPQKQAEAEWNQISSKPEFKDAKKLAEIKRGKLPGGGAGNANAYTLEASFKLNEMTLEYRLWTFQSSQNQWSYLVLVIGDEGAYKKHQKWIDFVLGSIKMWKVPKK